MANINSDSESECFESAEESLEEKEEHIGGKTRSKKNSRKSESELAEPAVFQNEKDEETVFPEDISVNLSYRKRPERIKRTPSTPSQKINFRSKKCNETVFKAEVADVFFQDITCKLSKNINRSLHTLQLTSANVKDLILSSCPAPSVSEGENFLYDDSLNILPPPVDNTILPNEAFDDERVFTNDCLTESQKFLLIQNNEMGLLDTQNIQSDGLDMHVIKKETLKINSEDNMMHRNESESIPISDLEPSHLSNSEIDEKIIGLNKLEPEIIIMNKLDSKLTTVVDNKKEKLQRSGDQVSQTVKLNYEESLEAQEQYKANLGQFAISISSKNNLNINNPECEKLNNEDAKSNFSCELQPESVLAGIDDIDITSSSQIQNYSDSIIYQEFFLNSTNKEGEQSADCKNLSVQNKKTLNKDAKTEFDKEDKTTDKSNKRENKGDYNVVEEQNEVKVKNEILKDRILEINFNIMESSNKSDNVSNGWDDFDFSDNEIEHVIESAKLNKSKNAGDMKVASTESSDFAENKIDTSFEAQKISAKKVVSLKKCLKEENAIDKKREEKEIFEKEGLVEEGWNLESWDYETDNTEGKERELSLHKATVKNYDKAENVPDDGSRWSGWDSFSQRIEEKQGNWNLGTWGVNLLLNKATAVTQEISNVLGAGLGAPDPETLARMQKEEERQLKQETEKIEIDEQPEEIPKKNSLTHVNLFPVSGITNLVAGVTSKIVEHTKIQEIGSKVLTGGLDTLETFGKKTMEVLQDGDPGLRNKRALLARNNKPVLSQILREAREKADKEIKQAEEKALAKKCHFETLFDDFQGLVDLKALEMLSRQYELKLDQLKSGISSEELEDLEGVLEEVEQLCTLDDLDQKSVLDFKPALQMAIEPLKKEISVEKIIQICDNANKWLQTALELDTSQMLLHQKAVSTVAELTAATVYEFLKAGELLSVKECRKTVDEIDTLAKFTSILCMEINKLCEKFISISDQKSKKEPDSTNIISEKVIIMRNNSTSYIKQAFHLLIPILQAGAVL